MNLAGTGTAHGFQQAVVGRIARKPTEDQQSRSSTILVMDSLPADLGSLVGYRAIVTRAAQPPNDDRQLPASPILYSVKSIDQLRDDHLASIEPRTGTIRTVYRPESRHNTLFATDRCNSNCLMCSQPPKDVDDRYRVALLLEQIELIGEISPHPSLLTITGGEPTLLGDNLARIVSRLRDRLPATDVQMLSNGRRFAHVDFARAIGALNHERFTVAVPLYADTSADHDFIVQSQGAFDQTVVGLHQLARHNMRVEIRVVLHALSIPRLLELAHYIYRNFPFAARIALMGLELTGYTRSNMDQLWIDPHDYQDSLRAAVEYLDMRGMNVAIYNHQLCLLDKTIWPFAHKTISDWKNVYFPECEGCAARVHCGGAFASSSRRRSDHIMPLTDLQLQNGHGESRGTTS